MLPVPRFALSYVDAYGAAIFAIALASARFVEPSANFFVAFSNDLMTILFLLIFIFCYFLYLCFMAFSVKSFKNHKTAKPFSNYHPSKCNQNYIIFVKFIPIPHIFKFISNISEYITVSKLC